MSKVVHVAAYTPGRFAPSARFRVRQHIAPLSRMNIEVHEFAPRLGTYPSGPKMFRPLWAGASIVERFPAVLASGKYDVTLLQRELLSTFVTLEPFTRPPRVLDIDDAIWVMRGGTFARRLAEMSDAVICGNPFIMEWFNRW